MFTEDQRDTDGGSTIGSLDRERQLKAAAENANACQESSTEQKRSTLIDRINRQQETAVRSARRADKLSELQYLLNKNPEVARILDLMEYVR